MTSPVSTEILSDIKTPVEDERLKAELLADKKELAEHNMLVDLGRNDIGKISKFGSVTVERYHEVLPYSHVMHIGSTVRGDIRDDCDAIAAINAILPAGTLSGAPKIKACQLINDLENNKRGIYGVQFHPESIMTPNGKTMMRNFLKIAGVVE